MTQATIPKPLILVTSSKHMLYMHWDWWSWHCTRYAIRKCGGEAVLVHAGTRSIPPYDGLLISGGVDIDPSHYGQENTNSFYCEPERDELELRLLKEALLHNKPVFGICRGAQLINIFKGGTLHQKASQKFRYYTPAKSVLGKLLKRKRSFIHSRLLSSIFDPNEKQWITSLHHQAIDTLGEGLVCIADDHLGMMQGIEEASNRFVLGLQWHPEYQLLARKHFAIFHVFIQACRQEKKAKNL